MSPCSYILSTTFLSAPSTTTRNTEAKASWLLCSRYWHPPTRHSYYSLSWLIMTSVMRGQGSPAVIFTKWYNATNIMWCVSYGTKSLFRGTYQCQRNILVSSSYILTIKIFNINAANLVKQSLEKWVVLVKHGGHVSPWLDISIALHCSSCVRPALLGSSLTKLRLTWDTEVRRYILILHIARYNINCRVSWAIWCSSFLASRNFSI